MTHERDMERLLDQWFSDGPTLAPDRVIEAVTDRIDRQSQRPAWRLDWRHLGMNTTFKLATAVAVIAIVAIVGYNLLPAGSTGTGGPAPSSGPAQSPSPTPRPAATSRFNANGPCGDSGSTCRGSLTAGTYTSRAMQPTLTYTVPSGWFNKFDQARGYGLLPETPENMNSLNTGGYGITTIEAQIDLVVARADCVEEPEPGVGTTASAMVQALAARPGLDTTEPAPVTIGGLAGYTIDIRMEPTWKTTCPFSEGQPTVPLVLDGEAAPGTGLHWTVGPVSDGSFTRYFILDIPGGGTVLISPGGPPSFITEATPIIQSFAFATTP
jgi:hypothetical protein